MSQIFYLGLSFLKAELLNVLCIKGLKKFCLLLGCCVFRRVSLLFFFEDTVILTLLHNPLSSSTNTMSTANWPGRQQIGQVDMVYPEDPDRLIDLRSLRDWSLIIGRGATKWENHGSETFCAPPPQDRVNNFACPCSS